MAHDIDMRVRAELIPTIEKTAKDAAEEAAEDAAV